MEYILLVILFGILMLPGLVLVFIPFLPSLSYMVVVALIFALIDKFNNVTLENLLILAGIWLVGVAIDYFAGLLGARFGGASMRSVFSGAVGSLIGLVIFPPFGMFIGLFLGVLISELHRHRTGMQAFTAARDGLIGSAVGMGINFILAIVMIVLFFVFAL